MGTSAGRGAQRVVAAALVVVVVPLLLSLSAFIGDVPIRVGDPAPRTVIAPDLVRVADPEATARARREAAEAVSPVYVHDDEAAAESVQRVRDVFGLIADVRQPTRAGGAGPPRATQTPSPREQVEALEPRLPMLDQEAIELLVALDDDELALVAAESEEIAQVLVREDILPAELDAVLDARLATELALRTFPEGIAERVVDPLIRAVVQPTRVEDATATAAARAEAAASVADVVRSYPQGTAIVQAGEVVDPVMFEALRSRGLVGSDPWLALLRAVAVVVLTGLVVSLYLRSHHRDVWRSPRRLMLLAWLLVGYTVVVEAGVVLTGDDASVWLLAVPTGALAMLATILLSSTVGLLIAVPVAAIVAVAQPGMPGLVPYHVLVVLVSVPLVSHIAARRDLRRAAWQGTLAYGALALTFGLAFLDVDQLGWAALAGIGSGVLGAILVQGLLPFLESIFHLVTVTSLIDLADRNHPLLRELEQKALGSYNHSITVSTLVERACRAVGADGLLGSVAALYHDIGKVRRPMFFVENQHGINPHDEVEPEISAVIIQDHVVDGVRMAREFRLPPEIVDGIASHHGTTLVSYFYAKALRQAREGEVIDEAQFR